MESRVTGWWVFAALLLCLSGVLNVIWGIAAIGNSDFYTANAHYIFSNLKTWGWITLIIGVIELCASVSLFQGGGFGRVIGIIAASLASIAACSRSRDRRFGRSACSHFRSSFCTNSHDRPKTNSQPTRRCELNAND